VQQSQLLYRYLGEGKVDAGGVAARPGEADDETESDRIVGDAECPSSEILRQEAS
jgi:hypothetical protein